MARTDRSIIFRERTNSLNFPTQKLKSGSNGRCRESFKLHVRDMGLVYRTQFKTSQKEKEVEDDEFSATVRREELIDYENCIWLSSGGVSSPSSCSQHNDLSGYMDLKIDAWFISLLSTPSRKASPVLGTEIAFFDGSRLNPIEEASLVLDPRITSDEDKDALFQEKLEDEEVVSWLMTSIEKENKSPVKDFTDFHKFSCSLPKQTLDKRLESELVYFQSRITTPVDESYSGSLVTDSSDEHSLFSSCSSSDYFSEVVDLEETDTDNPLFWPSDWTSDWRSETKCDFFIMSPRKDIDKVGSSQKTSTVPNEEPGTEKSCNRRPAFGTNSKRLDRFDTKNANAINENKKKRSIPSRVRKSTKTRMKIVPLHNEAGFGAPTETNKISDKKSELSCTRSVFATLDSKKGELSSSSATEIIVSDSEEAKTRTPVFWPSICATKWSSDTKWDLFNMSPSKNLYTSPGTMKLRVLNGKKDLERGCSRKLEFSSGSESSTDIKEGAENSSKSKSMKTDEAEIFPRKAVSKHKIVLEDLLLVDKLNADGAIEDVLGLSEFDGHEGVESGFDENKFSFGEIL